MNRTKLSTFFSEQIEDMKKNQVLLFDTHNLFYRCLHVSNNEFQQRRNDYLMGKNDKEYFEKDMFAYWRHLVMNSFLSTIHEKKPDRVVIALDDRYYWRKEIYLEYKANRKVVRDKSTINFDAFYPIMNEFINNLKELFSNIIVIKVNKCEADDIIATIVKQLSSDNLTQMEIVSNDRDFLQLQKYKNVKQYNPINKIYVKSINPKRDLEIKILMGDKGDNISAIQKGVGEKTAAKLLNGGECKKKTFDQLLEDNDIKETFKRNKKLIDFEYIPKEIEEKILNQYNNYDIKEIDSNKVWDWFLSEKMNQVSDDWQIYSNSIKRLK